MKKQTTIALASVAAFIVLLAFIKFVQIRIAMSQQFVPPPEAVTAATVSEIEWAESVQAVGNLKSVQGAELRIEEAGRVTAINFESGARVEAGAVLVELDRSVEEAALKAAVALVDRSKYAFDRAKMLKQKNATSAANYETADWSYRDALAKVEELRARVRRKQIVAPFPGITGVYYLNVGDYVNPGTPVVPLHNLDFLYVDFQLPESFLPRLKSGAEVELRVDAYPGRQWPGVVQAVDSTVDPVSRNVAIRAKVTNAGGELRSGMFADVELRFAGSKRLLVVPASSLIYAPYGDSVYLAVEVTKDGPLTAKQQMVKVGPRRGDQVAILSGLSVGDRVVTSGGFKLRPGVVLNIVDSVQPGSSANPLPADS